MMTTAQIVIFSVLFLGYILAWFKRAYEDSKKSFVPFLEFVAFLLMTLIATTVTVSLNDARKNEVKVTSKCPELEKVENVYRIKQ